MLCFSSRSVLFQSDAIFVCIVYLPTLPSPIFGKKTDTSTSKDFIRKTESLCFIFYKMLISKIDLSYTDYLNCVII